MEMNELRIILEELAPAGLAEPWDHSGMQTGRGNKIVRRVVTALDPSDKAVSYAVEAGADLLLTHHPLLFSPLREVTEDDPAAARVLTLAEHGICCYSMHTSYDSAPEGMAALAARRLGLTGCLPLEEASGFPGLGIGRAGAVEGNVTVREMIRRCREVFSARIVGLYGPEGAEERPVRRAAVCPGSGMDLWEKARELGADVYITGDVKYHAALDAAAAGLPVICLDHHSMETFFAGDAALWLRKRVPSLTVLPFTEEDPCRYY